MLHNVYSSNCSFKIEIDSWLFLNYEDIPPKGSDSIFANHKTQTKKSPIFKNSGILNKE